MIANQTVLETDNFPFFFFKRSANRSAPINKSVFYFIVHRSFQRLFILRRLGSRLKKTNDHVLNKNSLRNEKYVAWVKSISQKFLWKAFLAVCQRRGVRSSNCRSGTLSVGDHSTDSQQETTGVGALKRSRRNAVNLKIG